jgi:hypothetical protein
MVDDALISLGIAEGGMVGLRILRRYLAAVMVMICIHACKPSSWSSPHHFNWVCGQLGLSKITIPEKAAKQLEKLTEKVPVWLLIANLSTIPRLQLHDVQFSEMVRKTLWNSSLKDAEDKPLYGVLTDDIRRGFVIDDMSLELRDRSLSRVTRPVGPKFTTGETYGLPVLESLKAGISPKGVESTKIVLGFLDWMKENPNAVLEWGFKTTEGFSLADYPDTVWYGDQEIAVNTKKVKNAFFQFNTIIVSLAQDPLSFPNCETLARKHENIKDLASSRKVLKEAQRGHTEILDTDYLSSILEKYEL